MWRSVVSWTLFPVLLVGSLGATLVATRAGFDPTLVVMTAIFGSTVPILIAQRLLPAEARWRARPRDFGLDLLHALSTSLATEGWRTLTFGALMTTALWLQATIGGTLWPVGWPWWAQLALALAVGDFGAYWVHRSCHEIPVLWRLHAMHHSSERLYAFAGARNHPLNAILAYGSQLLPLTLLGAPVETIALISVFTGVHGLLQHCNVDLRHGALNWVFSTADLHRWHHSTVIEESNTNYGSNLILWDVVFRTRSLPEGRPGTVGLTDVRLPDNFLAHLASPFVLYRWAVQVARSVVPAPPREERS